MRDTAEEARTNSKVTFIYVPPTHGRASVSQPAKTYLRRLCADTECSSEDLPGVIDDRDGWKERVREICAVNMT